MTSNLFQDTPVHTEPWALTINRLKELTNQLLANPADRHERAVQIFVRESLLQIVSDSRQIHKANVVDVTQALEKILAAKIAQNVDLDESVVVASGIQWFEKYGLKVSKSEALSPTGLPLFLILWKQTFVSQVTETNRKSN